MNLSKTTMLKIKELVEAESGQDMAFMVVMMTQEEHDRVHDIIHNPTAEEVLVDFTSNIANIHPCVMEVCFSEMWGSREQNAVH